MLLTCSILFTFGVSGVALLAGYGFYYGQKDYFHTPEFEHGELNQFTAYLDTFAINDLSLEEAKEELTVSKEEIEEHRYRYGNLYEQVDSINQQYEELIQNALNEDNQEIADVYIEARDSKIEDITMNFESDEHVEAKIMKEKETALEDYYRDREDSRTHFEQLKESFQYYFKDTTTGKVYTNLNSKDPNPSDINDSNMLFVKNLSFVSWNVIHYESSSNEQTLELIDNGESQFEGRIGVPNNLAASNYLMIKNEEYKEAQIVFWTVIAFSIIAIILSFIIFKKAKKTRAEVSKWKTYYSKLPIDIRVVVFGFTIILTITMFFLFMEQYLQVTTAFIPNIIFLGLLVSIALAFLFVQSISLLSTFKNWRNMSNDWKKSVSYKGFMIAKKYAIKLIEMLKVAFLNQSTGIQITLLFGLVFLLGLAAVPTIRSPIFMVFYILLLGGIGIPTVFLIVNKIGDFNRIVENTNELVAGNLSPDIHVKGDTVLATLAENINVLKQGVRHSQSEQAKSERLKTELITNVSHDLRTPLTSIITYTELLKEQEELGEESAAYLEIIDRKSKRLKILIDDLFEISKMTSGNIELQKDKVDLIQLMQQALGEYDDTINKSGLHFRVSHDDPPIETLVDGQKLWRVFDNLIRNILIYSLERTRVYIHLSKEKNKAVITFKNVSKYELDENTDELFERFKRGDTSRHTEGSGLGLAIAQSIVELHDGSLEIEIDGDLFKVTIELPLQI